MKRVLVIGASGSGKSTFSRKLRDKTNLPLIYLDMIFHRADKTTIEDDEFDKKLNEVLLLDEWIIDGNYLRTLETRINRCDTVIYFDLPIEECIKGVENRIGTKREDLPWVEEEFDSEFKKWILDFPNKQTPKTYEILNKYKDKKDIVIFKSRLDAEKFLERI